MSATKKSVKKSVSKTETTAPVEAKPVETIQVEATSEK